MAEKPGLISLVRTGTATPETLRVNDFIWYARDVSNAYPVNGDGAHGLVNTGTPDRRPSSTAASPPGPEGEAPCAQ